MLHTNNINNNDNKIQSASGFNLIKGRSVDSKEKKIIKKNLLNVALNMINNNNNFHKQIRKNIDWKFISLIYNNLVKLYSCRFKVYGLSSKTPIQLQEMFKYLKKTQKKKR